MNHPAGDIPQLRPDKLDRQAIGERIDALVAFLTALNQRRAELKTADTSEV